MSLIVGEQFSVFSDSYTWPSGVKYVSWSWNEFGMFHTKLVFPTNFTGTELLESSIFLAIDEKGYLKSDGRGWETQAVVRKPGSVEFKLWIIYRSRKTVYKILALGL